MSLFFDVQVVISSLFPRFVATWKPFVVLPCSFLPRDIFDVSYSVVFRSRTVGEARFFREISKKKEKNREIVRRKKKKRETNINSRGVGEVVVLAEVKTEKFPNEYRLVVKNGKKEQRDVLAKLNLTVGLEKGGREWKERLLEGKEGQARSGNFSNRRSFPSAVASATRSRTLNYRISGDLTDFLDPL